MKFLVCLAVTGFLLAIVGCGQSTKTGIIQVGQGGGGAPSSSTGSSSGRAINQQLTLSSGSGSSAQSCLSLQKLSASILASTGQIAVNTFDLDFGQGVGKSFKSVPNNASLDAAYFLAKTSTLKPFYQVYTATTAPSDPTFQMLLGVSGQVNQTDCKEVQLSSGVTATIVNATANSLSMTTGSGATLKTTNYTLTQNGFIVDMYYTPSPQPTICGAVQSGLGVREAYAVTTGASVNSLPISKNLYSLFAKDTPASSIINSSPASISNLSTTHRRAGSSSSTAPTPQPPPTNQSSGPMTISNGTYMMINNDIIDGKATTGC